MTNYDPQKDQSSGREGDGLLTVVWCIAAYCVVITLFVTLNSRTPHALDDVCHKCTKLSSLSLREAPDTDRCPDSRYKLPKALLYRTVLSVRCTISDYVVEV